MTWTIDTTHHSDIHVYPNDDYRMHVPQRDCWCRPQDDDMDPYGHVVLHASLDGREQYTKEGGSIPLH